MKRLFSIGIALCAAAVVGSCFVEESRPAAPPMLPAAAGVITIQQAATLLAEARCDREARCNAIGPTAAYATPAHCLAVMQGDAQDNLASCQYGVKEREVYACAVEIRRQICGPLTSPFSWVGQVMVCRASNLCLQ